MNTDGFTPVAKDCLISNDVERKGILPPWLEKNFEFCISRMPNIARNANISNLEFGHENFTLTFPAPLLKLFDTKILSEKQTCALLSAPLFWQGFILVQAVVDVIQSKLQI